MHALVDRIEPIAQFFQLRAFGGRVGRHGVTIQRLFDFGQDQTLICATAVELKADRPKADLLKPSMDNVKSGHLLSDKKD